MKTLTLINQIQELQQQRAAKAIPKEELTSAQSRLVGYTELIAQQLRAEYSGEVDPEIDAMFASSLLEQFEALVPWEEHPSVMDCAASIDQLADAIRHADPEVGHLKPLLALACTSMIDGSEEEIYYSGLEEVVMRYWAHQDPQQTINELLIAHLGHELGLAEDLEVTHA